MRDRDGIVQVCFDPKYQDALTAAAGLRNEFCIQIKGEVIARPENQINKNMATGEVEVLAKELRVYNASDVLPLDFNQNNTEEQRLKYRYFRLRRPEMAQRLKTPCKNHQLLYVVSWMIMVSLILKPQCLPKQRQKVRVTI